VTLLYPQEYPLRRVLPRDLGLFVADYYRKKGVETVSGRASRASRPARHDHGDDAGGQIRSRPSWSSLGRASSPRRTSPKRRDWK
jgi:hypothetical protein